MSISIHPFTEHEIAATESVFQVAYKVQQSWQESLRRYLTLQGGCAFVAKNNGNICGFGGALNNGPFAYIGLMAVHPDLQKLGIGRLILQYLLDWLAAHNCATALLDATPMGAPLYEHCGFREVDHTLVLQHNSQHVHLQHTHLPPTISTLQENQLAELVVFDAPCFGAERGAILASYWSDAPARLLLAHDGAGQVTGYLVVQSGTLGPWVAQSGAVAEHLLVHALQFPFQHVPRVFVSPQHAAALKLLSQYGFSTQRTLSHMRCGKPVPRERLTTLYGQASLGFGSSWGSVSMKNKPTASRNLPNSWRVA